MSRKNSVTMQTIADSLGITKVSVSKAINNQPGVSESLKKQILSTASEIGYIKKNVQDTEKVAKKLGYLVSKRFFLEIDKFYSVIYYYLSRECGQKNIDLLLYIVNAEDEKNLVLPLSFSKDNLDGLFIAGEINSAYIQIIINEDIPIVTVDFSHPSLLIDSIVPDNFYASYLATLNLIDHGHKKIGFVGNQNYATSVTDRFYGYMKALAQNGLEYRKEWHLVNNDQNGVYTMDYLLPAILPTAFICFCDMSAYYLMQKLQIHEISVPGDVSLISFDNTDLSKNCNPPLTTVDIDKCETARKSLQRMLWRIGNRSEPAHRDLVNTQLIKRSTVSAPKTIS